MSRLRRLLLALCASLLTLGFAELIVRLFFAETLHDRNIHADAAQQYAQAGMLCSVEADGLRYTGRPGASVTIRDIRYAHNSLGLRGAEPQSPRPEGLFRILLLGDSNTYGWGVRLESTFGWLTEQRLQQALSASSASLDASSRNRKVEVLNAGFVGYNTGDALALFRHLHETLQPDLVLLVWFANDLERFGFHVSQAGHLFCDPLPLPEAWKPTLWRSYLYRKFSVWILSRMKSSGRFVLGEGENLTYSEGRLRALARAVRESGSRFALIDMPVLEPSPGSPIIQPEQYLARQQSNWLARIAGQEQIPLLEFLAAVTDRAAARYWVQLGPPADHHPNAQAHERFAEALTRFLLEQKLIP